jgi:hypothetical protein
MQVDPNIPKNISDTPMQDLGHCIDQSPRPVSSRDERHIAPKGPTRDRHLLVNRASDQGLDHRCGRRRRDLDWKLLQLRVED